MTTNNAQPSDLGWFDQDIFPAYRAGVSLFWRTFFLLALLLVGSVFAWTQTLRELEFEPRAIQTANQIASVVNLSRAAVKHADAIARVSLFKTMKDQEHVTIRPREPHDTFEPFDDDYLSQHIEGQIMSRLGPGTVVANKVNNVDGLWVGFAIEKRPVLATNRPQPL